MLKSTVATVPLIKPQVANQARGREWLCYLYTLTANDRVKLDSFIRYVSYDEVEEDDDAVDDDDDDDDGMTIMMTVVMLVMMVMVVVVVMVVAYLVMPYF